MAQKLFVGGLSYNINETQLNELFSQIGSVTSCKLIIDRYSGQSKGFGFVEMENDEEADKAIKELNGKEIEGRKIVVNVARPMEERPRNFSPDRRQYSQNNSGYGGRDDHRQRRGR